MASVMRSRCEPASGWARSESGTGDSHRWGPFSTGTGAPLEPPQARAAAGPSAAWRSPLSCHHVACSTSPSETHHRPIGARSGRGALRSPAGWSDRASNARAPSRERGSWSHREGAQRARAVHPRTDGWPAPARGPDQLPAPAWRIQRGRLVRVSGRALAKHAYASAVD